MAKVPGFAKAFAGRWRIVEMDNAEFSGKDTTRMTPPAVADQASFAHAAEFFNSLLDADFHRVEVAGLRRKTQRLVLPELIIEVIKDLQLSSAHV